MCCNDCTQHVLDGPLSVCTLVELCCAHVLVCQCLSCVAILAQQLKQTPFYPQNGSLHFSQCCHFDYFVWFIWFICRSPSQSDVSVVCLSPTTKRIHFMPEVFVVGINVNAPIFIVNTTIITHTAFRIFLDLTLVPFSTSSGTSLRVEIQNSQWKLSGYVMGEALISDRWLQNTSCVSGRSVWCRQHSGFQTCRFSALKCT